MLLTLALLLGAAAGVVARGFVSPAQQAARARPPAASLITARVRFGVLPATVTLRAAVSKAKPEMVGPPGDPQGSPVVTSVAVAVGQVVRPGQLVGTVAERPVFVFEGIVPAFRAMTLGVRGIDVSQLQAGLAAAGFGTGADAPGVYGPGTAAAVAALYTSRNVTPAWSGSPAQVTRLSHQAVGAQRSLSAALAKLAADRARHASASVLAADRAAVASAQHALGGAEQALAAARRKTGAEVPRGEVSFVPRLPARVLSVAALGSTARSSVAQLGSGRVAIRAAPLPGQSRELRVGMRAEAMSDLSGRSFGLRISAVRGSGVGFTPAQRLPAGVQGQNVAVTITTSRVRTLIVPVAAIRTAGSGQVYLTVLTAGGHTQRVPVRLTLSAGGEQGVSAARSHQLRPGEQVVLGLGTGG